MAEIDNTNDDLDFLGNGSMKEIMMRMGDIDKVLAEITEQEEKPRKSVLGSSIDGETPEETDNHHKENEEDNGSAKGLLPSLSYDDSTASIISDTDVYADDYGSGVADLQGELREFEESQRQATAEVVAARTAVQARQQESVSSQVATETKVRTYRRSVSATVKKPTPTSVVGISMKSSKGVTRIISILETGLLVGTELDAGMELIEVNGVTVTSARHARALIQSAPDKVSIVAHEISTTEF
jgi:hypothetical protein